MYIYIYVYIHICIYYKPPSIIVGGILQPRLMTPDGFFPDLNRLVCWGKSTGIQIAYPIENIRGLLRRKFSEPKFIEIINSPVNHHGFPNKTYP